METVAKQRGVKTVPFGAAAARVTILSSLMAAVAAGCWLLQMALPAVALAAAAIFIAILLLARWQFWVACALVLFFAYTSVGVLRLFTPSLSAASPWLAAFGGVVAGGVAWTRWRAPAAWQWPVMVWVLGVAISWPIIAAREADFAGVMRGDAAGAVVIAALSTLCVGLWLDAALTWDVATLERRVARPLLASVVISAAAVFYQAFIDITWVSGEPWIATHRAPGLMGDANPMAVAAGLWAPLAPFVFGGRTRLWLGPILTALLWYAGWLTGARSVVLFVASGAIGLAGGAIAMRTTSRRAALFVMASAVVGLVLVVVLSRQLGTGPIARLSATLPLDQPVAVAYEVLWRRDGYGLAAVRAIREHPSSGVGHGAFNLLASYYYRVAGGPLIIPPDNAQNLWRHTLAERGLLGFAAVLGFTIATCRLLFRPAANVPVMYAWTLKAMVVALGLALMFGLPIQNPAIALTAASLLAWLHAAVAPSADSRAGVSSAVVGLAWLLALAGAAVDVRNARGDLRPAWRAARVGDPYVHGFGELEAGPRGLTGRIVSDYAVVALRPAGPRYSIRCWVRGSDARHVRVWQNQRLVMDELLPAGVMIERLLDTPPNQGVLLEFDTDEPGIVVVGAFVVE